MAKTLYLYLPTPAEPIRIIVKAEDCQKTVREIVEPYLPIKMAHSEWCVVDAYSNDVSNKQVCELSDKSPIYVTTIIKTKEIFIDRFSPVMRKCSVPIHLLEPLIIDRQQKILRIQTSQAIL